MSKVLGSRVDHGQRDLHVRLYKTARITVDDLRGGTYALQRRIMLRTINTVRGHLDFDLMMRTRK